MSQEKKSPPILSHEILVGLILIEILIGFWFIVILIKPGSIIPSIRQLTRVLVTAHLFQLVFFVCFYRPTHHHVDFFHMP